MTRGDTGRKREAFSAFLILAKERPLEARPLEAKERPLEDGYCLSFFG